jgi:uncharacterized membrane protein
MANLHVAHVFATLHAGEMTRSTARRRQLTFDGSETACKYRGAVFFCAFAALGIYLGMHYRVSDASPKLSIHRLVRLAALLP